MVVCRFAPSPTGRLHIGGARTALFNWAWARHNQGKFLLRIEDTDRQRSLPEHEKAIIEAMDWLGLDRDGEIIRQSDRGKIYRDVILRLLEEGKVYRCFMTSSELDALRKEQIRKGIKPKYDRRWRDVAEKDWPKDGLFCIRFATPLEGYCTIEDAIHGKVSVANKEFDDPVIWRADNSPTYNLAAVVDDGEMGITDVIRGDDHLTNTMRQIHIHEALGQKVPRFAHLPMILGRRLDEKGEPVKLDNGEWAYERLSKRNMAVDVNQYRDEGFMREAMINYLAQLGWTQPGQEIYSAEELIAAFDIGKVHKSAARFDLERLLWINQQHLRAMPAAEVAAQVPELDASQEAIAIGLEKARTLRELRNELFWLHQPAIDDIKKMLPNHLGEVNRAAFLHLAEKLKELPDFKPEAIKQVIKACCSEHGLKFPKLGMPLRVSLTGREKSPDVAVVASILGQEACRARLGNALSVLTT